LEDFKRLEIPLHVTEGAKKCLAIIGQGYLACAVYGQTCLHSPDLLGWKTIHIAIDQDYGFNSSGENKATNNRISKLSGAHKLRKNGATVLFIEWSHRDGKGADDLLVNSPEKFHEAFSNPLKSIRNQGGKLSQWSIDVNQNYLELDLDKLGKAVLLRSPKGTGKSQLIAQWIAPYIENGHKILGITHRVSLGQACGDRWGLPWIDEDRRIGQGMICIHSMHSECKARFNPDDWVGAIVLIDELTQVLRDLVYSKLLDEHRAEILSNIKAVLCGASKILGMDADIDDECVFLLKSFGIDPTIVVNRYSPPLYPVTTFDKPGALLADLLITIAEGGKALALSDSQKNTLTGDASKKKAGGKFSSQALERRISKDYPHLKVLRVDAETLADKNHPAFQCLRYEGGRVRLALLALEYDVIIASPSINTGIDLSAIEGHFAGVWGFFNSGTLAPPDLSQFLARLRDPLCPRKICVKTGFNRNLLIGNGATSPRGLIEGCHSTLRASLECLSFTHDRTTIDACFLDYWAKMGAVSNGYSFDYRESCYQFLRDEGHTLTGSEAVQAIDDRQAGIALEIAEERAKLVRNAEDISDVQAEALDRKESLTQTEQAQLDKHRLKNRYGQPVTEELQLLDNTTGYSAVRLGWYLANTDAATESDRKLAEDLADKSWLPTTAKRSVSGQVKALIALELPKFLEREEFSNGDPQVNDLLKKSLECSVQIKNLLGVTVTAKTTPIALMRELGKKIGRKLELVRRSGNDRFYRFAPIHPLILSIYGYWDAKAESEKTVSDLDTKCVTSGNKIIHTQPSSDAIQPSSDAIQPSSDAIHPTTPQTPINKGRWAGMKGTIVGIIQGFLEGQLLAHVDINGHGLKSIPLEYLGGVA
jgi:hypothetical protein